MKVKTTLSSLVLAVAVIAEHYFNSMITKKVSETYDGTYMFAY